MGDEIFSVEVNKSFNVLNQEWQSEIYFKIYLSMFKSGLVRDLGSDRFAVLLAIASFMDESGKCYPTQEQIADVLGISRTTANKRINALLEFRWNGRPIIERQKVRFKSSPNENSVYTVLPLSQLAIFSGEVEAVDASADGEVEKQRKSVADDRKQLVTYFIDKYRETYSSTFSVNWGRDMGHARRILADRTLEEAKQILDVIFEEYDERWASGPYPRPSLGQAATWLGAQADQIASERAQQVSRYEEALHGGKSAEDLVRMLSGGVAL
ncbi:helix-turn-helix domain-containing protein [Paenibacillus sp. 1P03SA]|uniref:helix-turn-helix domain-containing protein n=1 Tax=Paenibacillus sp. 1P03SA TaxID=3132294 RepID=UPI0039A3802D